jgi:carbonic anhydrase
MNVKKTVWYRSISSVLLTITVALFATASTPVQGLQQSPIDIRARDLVVVDHLPALRFMYGNRVTLNVINTGSPEEEATVRAIVPTGAGQLRVAGVTYNLLQFHWHTPAEHLIRGKGFPMEMHLVHQAANGTLLVVGIFIEKGERHSELDKIFVNLPEEEGQDRTVGNFNLRRLLPADHASFRYDGSLTTSPFTEGVKWVVLAEPIELSRRQIEDFKNLFPEGNSREVQPLNGRKVLTDTEQDHH